MDIFLNIAFSLITIVCSVVAVSTCRSTNQLHKLPEPLAITGGVILIIGAAALALLYRYKEEVVAETPKATTNTSQTEEPESRKSIFA